MILYPYIFALEVLISVKLSCHWISPILKCLYLVHLAARLMLVLWLFAFHCACSSVPSHPGWRLVEPRCIVSFPVKAGFFGWNLSTSPSFMHKLWNFLGNEAVKLSRAYTRYTWLPRCNMDSDTLLLLRSDLVDFLLPACWRREILPFWENGIWIFCL